MDSNITHRRSFALRLAAGGLAALIAVSPAHAQFKDWLGGSGNWSSAGSWTPLGVPQAFEIARIGTFTADGFVSLDVSDTVAGLVVTNGMTFSTGGNLLAVNGPVAVSGLNDLPGPLFARSIYRVQNGANGTDSHADSVSISDQAWVELTGGAVFRVDDSMSIASTASLRGRGTVNFMSDAGTDALVNGGTIVPSGGDLVIVQFGDALLDLDGASGTGRLLLDSPQGGDLQIIGTELADPFSSEILLTPGRAITIDMAAGWMADSTSRIELIGDGVGGHTPAFLGGGDWTLRGDLIVGGEAEFLRVQSASTTIQHPASVTVGFGDSLHFETPTLVTGGFLSARARWSFMARHDLNPAPSLRLPTRRGAASSCSKAKLPWPGTSPRSATSA